MGVNSGMCPEKVSMGVNSGMCPEKVSMGVNSGLCPREGPKQQLCAALITYS